MLYSLGLLSCIVKEAKSQGKKIIFTNGCFDIIHSGHCRYLIDAKKLGDILIVGLNSDASVKRLKGNNRPVNNQEDRAEVLSALKPIDYVVLFEDDTPFNLISEILPNVLVKGGDYISGDIVGADIVRENDGEVIVLQYINGKSTSNIINKLRNNH